MFTSSFLEGQGFEKIEDYVEHCSNERIPLLLEGSEFFHDLFKKKIIKPHTGLRTFYNRGGADGSYFITEDGKLEGITDLPYHQGLEGIHEPDKLLSIDESPDGWSVDRFFPISRK